MNAVPDSVTGMGTDVFAYCTASVLREGISEPRVPVLDNPRESALREAAQCHSKSSLDGNGGNFLCGSFWYQKATDAMSFCAGR